ncbi:hypothetical protein PUNSTDRAFT_60438, partial [Punctularia strigosozonata HHB-11173 SS5]|uniref:uncharacterized protein n=1 Tax=Punctularia strigosozonata (strain HHB-11173) TaxID=741275 RepID=UPI0004417CE3
MKALSLTPPGHRSRAVALMLVATSICYRFDHLGSTPTSSDLPMLDRATALLEEALKYRPEGHRDRGDTLTILADITRHRMQVTSGFEDREYSLRLRKETLKECPPGHPQRHQAL